MAPIINTGRGKGPRVTGTRSLTGTSPRGGAGTTPRGDAGGGRAQGAGARRRAGRPGLPRIAVRTGIFGLAITLFVAGIGAVVNSGVVDRTVTAAVDGSLAATADAGFTVRDVLVMGRHSIDPDTVLKELGVGAGSPILGFDPASAARRLKCIDGVEHAHVARRLPDTIIVALVEREAVALWQHRQRLVAIDRTGALVARDDLDRFHDLPILIGPDVPRKVGEFVDLLSATPQLSGKVSRATRVGCTAATASEGAGQSNSPPSCSAPPEDLGRCRRWDVELFDKALLRLPEVGVEDALERLAALDRLAEHHADRIRTIDLRVTDRVVISPDDGTGDEVEQPDRGPRGATDNPADNAALPSTRVPDSPNDEGRRI